MSECGEQHQGHDGLCGPEAAALCRGFSDADASSSRAPAIVQGLGTGREGSAENSEPVRNPIKGTAVFGADGKDGLTDGCGCGSRERLRCSRMKGGGGGGFLWKRPSTSILRAPAATWESYLSSSSLGVDGMTTNPAAALVVAGPLLAPIGLWHPQQHSSDAPHHHQHRLPQR